MVLHAEERKIDDANDQVDLERQMFVTNPEMWKEVYAKDIVQEGSGVVIQYPTNEEEFEQMLKDWEGDGYVPTVG